ncbi:MAG: hypothetical protein LLF89_06160 [Spirochaetaceae bacterium]|nr:hypothetical protein [Spirochaetaceae bacterium]
MKSGPDVSTIYRIARYYYSDGLSQEEIGAREGFSRSQISRIIDRAREMGLVKISLVPPTDLQSEELSGHLSHLLDLRSVVVVPVRRNASQDEISLAIATRAAEYIPERIQDYKTVGIGWGRTVYRTAELLPHCTRSTSEPFFVPLIGISGNDNPNLQINTIIDRFAASFHTKGLFVNIPSAREMGAPVSKIEMSRIATLSERWKSVEAAVVGLGEPPTTAANLPEELPQAYEDELRKSNSKGDILAQYFGPDGRIFHAKHGYDLLAYNIQWLSGLDRSICLAGGSLKHEGIIAAARAGFITDLVTDELTALAIEKKCEEEQR